MEEVALEMVEVHLGHVEIISIASAAIDATHHVGGITVRTPIGLRGKEKKEKGRRRRGGEGRGGREEKRFRQGFDPDLVPSLTSSHLFLFLFSFSFSFSFLFLFRFMFSFTLLLILRFPSTSVPSPSPSPSPPLPPSPPPYPPSLFFPVL